MQVDESSQRKGLGAFMMNALEAVAKHWNMTKLVLTVLKNNEDAVRFYQRIGYTKKKIEFFTFRNVYLI